MSARRPSPGREAAPWLVTLGAGVAVLALAMSTLPSTTGAASRNLPDDLQSVGSAVSRSAPPARGFADPTLPPPEPSGDAPRPSPAEPVTPPSSGAAPPIAGPAAISLDGSETHIPVVPIGVSSTGVLQPPDDPAVVGWWAAGPRPGEPGRAIITGHIDSPAGLGAFAALDGLEPGDPVLLTGTDGTIRHYRVTARQEIEKTMLDAAQFVRADGSDLLLVTCIGRFDESSLSYDSNLLITAQPAAG